MFFGGLIVLALTAALVAPYFIDWTSYRADFEREASAILGRKVTVKGDAAARLLPFPSVTFSDVSVGGAGGEPAMTVETFSMDAELAPFLRGEFLIFDMRMVRPKAVVDIAEDGTIDWAMRPSSPFPASRIALEKLTVSDGEVTIRHQLSGRTHVISGIDTQLAAKSLAGPWRVEGSLKFDGAAADVSISTGTVDPDGRMRVRFKAAPADPRLTLDADGQMELRPYGFLYSGTFRLAEAIASGASAEGVAAQPVAAGRTPAARFRVNGDFALDNSKLDVPAFRVETGPLDEPYTADGQARLDFGAEPRFMIKASGAQVQFDEALGAGEGASLSLEQRIEALETALLSVPKPAIPGSIVVDVPAIVAGDTTIRDVRLSAEPAGDGWSIKSAGATLPGRTTLEADGFLRTDGGFGFKGNLLLAIAQPSGFAAWVARDIDDAIRRLPAAGFSAKVDMTHGQQQFRDLELQLGNARFRGEIDSRQPADARPSVAIKLDGEALDVAGLSAFASLFVSDGGRARFGESDIDLQIKAGPVSVAGLKADTIDTALRLRQAQLEIDRLSIGGIAGASISATGVVKDFPENPTGNVDASLMASDLAPLARLAAQNFPENFVLRQLERRVAAHPGLLADARLDIVASAVRDAGGLTEMALSLQGDAGGSAISASLSGNGRAPALRDAKLSLSLSARNGDATALLALAGLPVLPLGAVGAGELTLSANGAPASGMETSLELKGDQFLATFKGTSMLGEDGFAAKGDAKLEAADIEPWLMTTGVALPGLGLGMSADVSSHLDFGSDLLVLDGLRSVINESSIAGDLNIGFAGDVPSLDGALVLDELALEPFAAMIVGKDALAGKEGEWPSAPFSRTTALPFTVSVEVSVGTVTAGTFSAYDATLALGVDADGLRVGDLKATRGGGALSGRFELKNNGGTGIFSGQMRLDGFDLASEEAANGLAGKADLSATLSGSGKSVEAIVASLSGSGTASFRNLQIDGINQAALPAFLARADEIGRDVDTAKVTGFAPEIAGAGSFAGGDADVAFTVAGGILRAPPVTFANPAARLSVEPRGDFRTGELALTGSITYAAGDAAMAGSEPTLRISLQGRPGSAPISFDSEPLAQFLTQRALEREQARVEAMQAVLIEKQRLRREVRYYAALQAERDRLAEEALRKAEEEARLKAAEEERQRIAAEEAKHKAEADARAAEEARLRAEEDEFKRIAEEEAKRKAEEARAAEEARVRAEEEEFKHIAEEEAKRQAEQNTNRRATPPAPQRPAERQPEPVPSPIDEFIKSLTGS